MNGRIKGLFPLGEKGRWICHLRGRKRKVRKERVRGGG